MGWRSLVAVVEVVGRVLVIFVLFQYVYFDFPVISFSFFFVVCQREIPITF